MSSGVLQDGPQTGLDLGVLREEFSVSHKDLLFVNIVLPIAAVGIGVFFFLKMLAVVPPGPWAVGLCLVACGAISLAIAREAHRAIRTAHSRKDMRVLIFDDGFCSIRPDDVFTGRWDEVEWTKELFADPNHPLGKDCPVLEGLTVHCRGGREWKLDRKTEYLRDSLRLAATIQEQVAQRMLPQALANLQKGTALDFGAVQLTLLGITHQDRMLSWADVKAIVPRGFGLKIERRGAWRVWATIVARDLINKYLLLAVAEAKSKEQRTGCIWVVGQHVTN